MSYFALSLPSTELNSTSDVTDSKPTDRVFQSREEALKALKSNKNSRLKSFATQEEAVHFASDPKEALLVPTVNNSSSEDSATLPTPAATGEGCPFKGLTPQEMNKLKQSIANEDVETFEKLVASNPRYLMTPCDTPSVLHSGTRSNALHVAALSGSVKMTLKVIEAIQDPYLLIRMYPGENAESRSKRQEFLFDMYLNTPKKGDFDTPLHQASKYGHLEVVKLLSEFSSCDTKRKNKEGLTPSEVACTRMGTPVDIDVKRRIIDTLSDHVYIPVFRTMDLSTPAYIGEPWSPCASSMEFQPVALQNGSETDAASPKPPMSPFGRSPSLGSPLLVARSGGKQTSSSPRQIMGGDQDPLTSPLTVRALLGPVSPVDAAKIQQEWKKSSAASKLLRLTDPHKGLERQGRALAQKYKTGILEYWDFLNTYVDLSSTEGLILLENHLAEKLREYEDEEARKIIDLERDLADLKIDSNDDSFFSSDQKKNQLNGVSSTLDFKTSYLVNQANGINVSNLNSQQEFRTDDRSDKPSSPLSDAILWNQVRVTLNNSTSSLNTTSGLTESDLDNSNNLFSHQRSLSSTSLNNSFHSAASSLNESMMTADEGVVAYLEGLRPSNTDCQVYSALESVNVNPEKFPNVHTWMNMVGAVPENERSKWKPIKIQKKTRDLETGRKRLSFDD